MALLHALVAKKRDFAMFLSCYLCWTSNVADANPELTVIWYLMSAEIKRITHTLSVSAILYSSFKDLSQFFLM